MNDDLRARTISAILHAAKAGDARAANQLYVRLWPVVFGYCYHRLRQPSSAEDAAQEAMVEIILRAAEIRATAVMRDLRVLVKMGNRDLQRLLREVADEDLGRAVHVVAPEIRSRLEHNVSPRVREWLRRIPPHDGKAQGSVRRPWQTLDDLLDAGEIGLVPRETPQGAGTHVAAVASGPGQTDRAAWLHRTLQEGTLM